MCKIININKIQSYFRKLDSLGEEKLRAIQVPRSSGIHVVINFLRPAVDRLHLNMQSEEGIAFYRGKD
jgi:hypothetical protein